MNSLPKPMSHPLPRKPPPNRPTSERTSAGHPSRILDSPKDQPPEAPNRRAPPPDVPARDKTTRRPRAKTTDPQRHLEIYKKHIRRLTIENSRYKDQLE